MGDFLVFCAALGMTVLCASELRGAARGSSKIGVPLLITLFCAILGAFAFTQTQYALAKLEDGPVIALLSIFLAALAVSQILHMIGAIEANPPLTLIGALGGAFVLAEILFALGIIDTDPMVVASVPLQRLRDLIR